MPLLIISPISSKKAFTYWEAVKLLLQNSNFILGNKCCQLFYLRCQTQLICFQEMSTKVWIMTVFLSDVVSIKYGVQCRTQLVQHAAQPHKGYASKYPSCFSMEQHESWVHGALPDGYWKHCLMGTHRIAWWVPTELPQGYA